MAVPKKKLRAKRARAKQRPRGRDLRDQYRPSDLPPAPDIAVVEFDDPHAASGWIEPDGTLNPEARQQQARRADGSIADGEPEWVAPPRPRVRAVARLKEDPLGRMLARHQVDRHQHLAGREYQQLYDATQVGLVRSVDLSKTKVSGGRYSDPLTDARQRSSRKLHGADDALRHRHGVEGLTLVRDVLCERRAVEQAGRLRGASNDWELRWFSILFRKCLSVLAVQFGFASSTARPHRAPLNGTGDADPADDPARCAAPGDLKNLQLRSARGRANGGD
jgi:hypothetical protein